MSAKEPQTYLLPFLVEQYMDWGIFINICLLESSR